MNSFVETLNLWSEHALRFAWPMFWQSSLLILLIFALDFALRRKVRAAVRYALWLIVLVKLLLPPTIASPTSLAWWLRQPAPAPVVTPVQAKLPDAVVVSYETLPAPAISVQASPLRVTPSQPTTPISAAAWGLLTWGAISIGFFLWVGVRWRQVTQHANRAFPASAGEQKSLAELIEDSRRLAGVRQPVPCRLVDGQFSPAVCGLFRPVILLPRPLVEQLPPAQLRAILVHELIHLRRRDVWVNCLQALLQFVYWWHPLLWLANARIRRLREEAVDDAVMLALAEDSDAYAPTLLEVAKLAYYRPLTALGLVGILESRRGLRQRIERLMNFNTPRRAGLSIVSALGIAALTALAVPMGEGPARSENPSPALSSASTNLPAVSSQPDAIATDNEVMTIISDSAEMRPGAVSYTNVVFKHKGTTTYAKWAELNIDTRELTFFHARSVLPSGQTWTTAARMTFSLGTNSYRVVRPSETNAVLTPAANDAEPLLIRQIKVDPVRFSEALRCFVDPSLFAQALQHVDPLARNIPGPISTDPGSVVRRFFAAAGVDLDPAKGRSIFYHDRSGLFLIRATASELKQIETRLASLEPDLRFANSQVPQESENSSPAIQTDLAVPVPRVNVSAPTNSESANYSAAELIQNGRLQFELGNLDAAERQVREALALKPDDHGALYLLGLLQESRRARASSTSARDRSRGPSQLDRTFVRPVSADSTNLLVRTFKVDPNTFYQGLLTTGVLPANADTNSFDEISAALKKFFRLLDVDLESPKTVFFDLRKGLLIVRATRPDLDLIEAAVQTLNTSPPQVTIKVKWVEFATDDKGTQDFESYLRYLFQLTNATSARVATSTAASRAAANPTGILTDPQYREVLRRMERQRGLNLLNDGQITTLSGRQAQLQIVEMKQVLSHIKPEALNPPGIASSSDPNAVFQTKEVPCGPVLDVVPIVGADGYTVHLNVTASITEFLGYEDLGKTNVTVYINDKKRQVVPRLPKFRVRQLTTEAIVWDGQTVVLSGLVASQPVDARNTSSARNESVKKNLILFLTPTIIDPAGNRLHADAELPIR